MMNVLISIGNRVTDVLPDGELVDNTFEFGPDIRLGCWSAVVQGKRDASDAHWLAPKVVSTAEVMV